MSTAVRFPALQKGDTFPLWQFGDVITRGRTPEEAERHIGHAGPFQQSLDVRCARLYTTNHEPGWLHRPMYWLCEALGEDPAKHGHRPRPSVLDRYMAEILAGTL